MFCMKIALEGETLKSDDSYIHCLDWNIKEQCLYLFGVYGNVEDTLVYPVHFIRAFIVSSVCREDNHR